MLREVPEIKLWIALDEFREKYRLNKELPSWPEMELTEKRIHELKRRGANPKPYEQELIYYQRAKRYESI